MRAYLPYQILTGHCKARIIQILWYWLRDRENNRGILILEFLLVKGNIFGGHRVRFSLHPIYPNEFHTG